MKHFKLPKQFTENWLKALRGNTYDQAKSTLVETEVDEDSGEILHINGYCCLGVACSISGIKDKIMAGSDLIYDLESLLHRPDGYEIIPDILKTGNDNNSLVKILTSLNDGLRYSDYKEFITHYKGISFSRIPPRNELHRVFYSFEEIADWIENNVELID